MPTKQQNFSNIPQTNTHKSKWSLMPYFLYFIFTLGGTIYLYWPEPYYIADFLPGLTHLLAFINWGMFIVACLGYFVIRKYIVKKEGFKSSIYIFIANMLWIFIGLYLIIGNN